MKNNEELIELISTLEEHLEINDIESLQLILRLLGENKFLLNEEDLELTEALDSLLLTYLGLVEQQFSNEQNNLIHENKAKEINNFQCGCFVGNEPNPADNFFNNFISIHMGETMLKLQN